MTLDSAEPRLPQQTGIDRDFKQAVLDLVPAGLHDDIEIRSHATEPYQSSHESGSVMYRILGAPPALSHVIGTRGDNLRALRRIAKGIGTRHGGVFVSVEVS